MLEWMIALGIVAAILAIAAGGEDEKEEDKVVLEMEDGTTKEFRI